MSREDLSHSDELRRCLRRCALEIDPNGEFTALADELGVVPGTIGNWIRDGRVPLFQGRKISRRFGKIAPLSTLCPDEYA